MDIEIHHEDTTTPMDTKALAHMSAVRRWLVMTCLCLSGGIIYLLPFLREVYHLPLQNALRLSPAEFGLLMAVFGMTQMLCYFPGGWLADRFSPRRLMTVSLAATGATGLYLAIFPGLAGSLAVHAGWGISITLGFWAALIKSTRDWAPADRQGRAFGILESGRGLAELGSSTLLLMLFARLGSGDRGLGTVITMLSAANILLGLLTWLVIRDPVHAKARDGEAILKPALGGVLAVLKHRQVWLISVVVLAAYSAYWGTFYFTPYASEVFGMSLVAGGMVGVGKMWLKPFSALAAGFLADRAGIAHAAAFCFGVLTASFAVFALLPDGAGVPALIANTAAASIAVFSLRGIYFALLGEGGVPASLTGTAAGVISVVGFTPDIFMPVVGGELLERYPGASGYSLLFSGIACLCALGLLASLIIGRHRQASPPHR